MTNYLKKEGKYTYAEAGEGRPLIILHGLMGALSNFDNVFKHFSENGYKVLIPELPLYSLPIIKTNVKNLAKFLHDFIEYKNLEDVVLLGNSLGGHIALYYIKHYPKDVSALVLTGSSGLYENSMGNNYPRRGDKEFVRVKQRFLAKDKHNQLVFLADSSFSLQMTQQKFPSIKFHFVSEFN